MILERLDGKDYKLRGDDDIKEMKKYVSSDDLYEWFTNKLDDLDYVVVDYGIRDTATGLVSASIFHLGDSYKDGIQMNFTVHSKLPLNKDEIRFAVEALTSFDDDGNYPIKFKGGKKYKSTSLVFTSVPSDYKVSTWIMTDKPVNNRYYKNLKAYQVGTQNNKKMPTYPILDAKQYYATGDEEARFMYPKNKAAHDKHKDSKQVKPTKPVKPTKRLLVNPPAQKEIHHLLVKRDSKPKLTKKGAPVVTRVNLNRVNQQNHLLVNHPAQKEIHHHLVKKDLKLKLTKKHLLLQEYLLFCKSSCKKEIHHHLVKKDLKLKLTKKAIKTKSKPTKPSSNKSSCTKRNPSPPCKKGFETKTNKKAIPAATKVNPNLISQALA